MTLNGLKIERDDRRNGQRFIERNKVSSEGRYSNNQIIKKCLRDNSTKIKKDQAIMNPIKVRQGKM